MAIDAPPQYAPPGHFYSPVPSNTDIERAVLADGSSEEITGINFRELQQLLLLDRLAKYYGKSRFPLTRYLASGLPSIIPLIPGAMPSFFSV